MKWAAVAMFVAACSRQASPASVHENAEARGEVPAVFDAGAPSGLVAPDPACTCASPESSPAPTPFEVECEGWLADCEDLHYASFDARAGRASKGVLLATHEVESKVYDATISFSTRGADSTMRVSIGDLIPTPRGVARVVRGASLVRFELGRWARDLALFGASPAESLAPSRELGGSVAFRRRRADADARSERDGVGRGQRRHGAADRRAEEGRFTPDFGARASGRRRGRRGARRRNRVGDFGYVGLAAERGEDVGKLVGDFGCEEAAVTTGAGPAIAGRGVKMHAGAGCVEWL